VHESRSHSGGWGVRSAAAWLLLVAVVGLLAPLLAASGSGWLSSFGPFERPAVSGATRLPPFSSRYIGTAGPLAELWAQAQLKRGEPKASLRNDAKRIGFTADQASWIVDQIANERGEAAGTPEFFRTVIERMPGVARHRLGTDSLGQDVLSNLIHACRSALLVGIAGAGTALLIGITLGAVMGYFGGWVDLLLMRVVEVFMSVPLLFLLVLGAAVLPREPLVIMGLIGAVTWTGVARLTRAEVMRVRGMDFVDAARASGLPAWRVVVGHVLPSAVAPAMVEGAFLFAAAILFEATLSFLNLGPVDRASWGRLLAQAAGESGDFAWWLAVFPGLCVVLTVLSCQTLGTAGRVNRAGGGQT
jgi:peptide/nickel transport system permease protein